ncbi:MAG: LysR family transcriptional regulator [Deltaproteobacteria bacterium]|nr:MAG: LysR family transcriptional regulator [Deltaproteobacteria bacterium]
MIDLNEMTIFVRVVDSGTITGAARELQLPKSTVSRRIASLEERLGVQLLLRTTRRLRLTEAGSAYYERASVIVRDAEAADRAAGALQDQPWGMLRISAPPVFADAYFGPLLSEYLRRHPDVQIDLDVSLHQVDLLRDGYDAVIRAGVLHDSSLMSKRIGDRRYVHVASPAYLQEFPRPEHPNDLARHRIVTFGVDGPGPVQWNFERDGESVQIGVNGRLHVNNFAVARDAALDGLGIARLPLFVCVDALREGRLVSVLDPWIQDRGGIYILWPDNRHMPAKLRAFIDLVDEVTRHAAPWHLDDPALHARA